MNLPYHYKLLPPEHSDGVVKIYSWFRYCMDVMDGELLAFHSYNDLKYFTASIWTSRTSALPPAFAGLEEVALQHKIPAQYPMELLRTLGRDQQKYEYNTIDELKDHCYRIAGMVGLMIWYVARDSKKRAPKEAADLGMAMELTNVVLDLEENYFKGRCYLPLDWLDEVGLTKYNYWEHENREALMLVVARLIHVSEKYYLLGVKNLRGINLRAALTVAISLMFHRQKGTMILQEGSKALGSPIEIPWWIKALLIFQAMVLVLRIKMLR